MSAVSAVATAERVRSRKTTARAEIEAALSRIKTTDGPINAFVALDEDGALAAADAIDRAIAEGRDPGPFAGAPVAIKDNEHVKGLATKHGSLLHANAAPEAADSEHVARLKRAGAIVVGKTATGEFGLDALTYTLAHGVTRNPWNLERTPGGSSGGAGAAIAAGLVGLATGSDALGSIRAPAAYCGCLGLKPTHGRIPRAHGFRDTASIGPLAATIADIARYLDVVSGPSRGDRASLPLPGVNYERETALLDMAGLRVAFSPDLGFAPVAGEVADACAEAFARLSREAKLTIVPAPKLSNVYVEWNELAALELKGDFELAGILPDRIDQISPTPRAFIESIKDLSSRDQAAHRAKIRALEAETAALFERADVVITPSVCCGAYGAEGPIPTEIDGKDASRTHAEPLTAFASICWLPSLSAPVGFTSEGMPIGMLINGPRGRDDIVLRLGAILERIMPWPHIAPGFGGGS